MKILGLMLIVSHFVILLYNVYDEYKQNTGVNIDTFILHLTFIYFIINIVK